MTAMSIPTVDMDRSRSASRERNSSKVSSLNYLGHNQVSTSDAALRHTNLKIPLE